MYINFVLFLLCYSPCVADEVLRKALWLKIAVFAIAEHKSIKPAVEIMKESDCLKIEDILPHFPDFVVIDDFKEDICSALEECRPPRPPLMPLHCVRVRPSTHAAVLQVQPPHRRPAPQHGRGDRQR
jgi:hypothetical protein